MTEPADSDRRDEMGGAPPRPSFPTAMEPFYTTRHVNEPVTLYSGRLTLGTLGKELTGFGAIEYVWTPDSEIRFRLDLEGDPVRALVAMLQPREAQTITTQTGGYAGCFATRISKMISGIVNEPMVIGGAKEATKVYFHLLNCESGRGLPVSVGSGVMAARLVFVAGGWRIIIDPVSEIARLHEELQSVGGYAITHVGCLERIDASVFKIDEAQKAIDCVHYFLSFAHGIWVAPVLVIATDAEGRRVQETWKNAFSSSYQRHTCWCAGHSLDSLAELFPKFFSRWHDPLWNDTLRRAIWWYVASNEKAGGLDGAIILVQVALELLAWVVLVEDGHLISRSGFEKLSAADRLRLLVSRTAVSLALPPELQTLSQFAKTQRALALRPVCLY